MKRSLGAISWRQMLFPLLAGILCELSLATEGPLHFITSQPTESKPLTPAAMTRRIEEAAARYAGQAPVPRVAFFDYAYPANRSEAESLKGYAVLLVIAICQDVTELPPKAAYVQVGKQRIELRHLVSVPSHVAEGNTLVAKTFGSHRTESLYLLPLHAAMNRGVLFLDFAANREGFKLGELVKPPRGIVQRSWGKHQIEGDPSMEALAALLRREYPGFLAE